MTSDSRAAATVVRRHAGEQQCDKTMHCRRVKTVFTHSAFLAGSDEALMIRSRPGFIRTL